MVKKLLNTTTSNSVSTPVAVFFPNLNGIRCIASLLVLFHHMEILKAFFGMKNFSENIFIARIGGLGVVLFFVLSGFLITYLLLAEKQKHSHIAIKSFYMRRILRIWPLYYLVVIIAFLVLPRFEFFYIPYLSDNLLTDFSLKLTLYLLILPNVASVVTSTVPYAGQAWSVGVEEQFYLLWPIILSKTQHYLEVLCAIIVVIVMFSNGFLGDGLITLGHYLHISNPDWYTLATIVTKFFKDLRISCMAIGGIGAYLLFFNKEEILKILFSRSVQLFIYVVLILLLLRGTSVSQEFYAVLFIIFIMNMAANTNRLFSLENPIINYLGKISFGLYMCHNIAIVIAIRVFLYFFSTVDNLWHHLILTGMVFSIAIIIAALSYHCLEIRFMKLKLYFSRS
ncbi:acyltransferase [Xanthocytophaga agilis]|uniref:Acyltransferase n=1 Tax=Xanthocytophaga agilis TaxID=3048010 RepID=A0AAE3R0U8_9BACT|nr:acyltransferase [Xanthocytophaga agilis]MDJ1499360.1 acyltransferase [Xanthocytophaga agilis]